MLNRNSIGTIALMAALCASVTAANAFDDAKYPDLKGKWDAPKVMRAQGDSIRPSRRAGCRRRR
jgi:hypothetical protein